MSIFRFAPTPIVQTAAAHVENVKAQIEAVARASQRRGCCRADSLSELSLNAKYVRSKSNTGYSPATISVPRNLGIL